jgi:hypothetical protein
MAAMKPVSAPRHRIELHLRELAQLFNSMDPTPFHHKDLDPDAEEFIKSWALEFPSDSHFQISIHLEKPPADGDPSMLVAEAIHNYFDYEAELVRRELSRLLRQGRVSLLIGLTFLASCLVIADTLARFATAGTFVAIMRESLTIGGWVALWRPLEIFLYDWWPLVRRRRIYRNLARAQVRVTTGT